MAERGVTAEKELPEANLNYSTGLGTVTAPAVAVAEAETEDICRVWAQTVMDTVNEVIEENFRKLPKNP